MSEEKNHTLRQVAGENPKEQNNRELSVAYKFHSAPEDFCLENESWMTEEEFFKDNGQKHFFEKDIKKALQVLKEELDLTRKTRHCSQYEECFSYNEIEERIKKIFGEGLVK